MCGFFYEELKTVNNKKTEKMHLGGDMLHLS